MRIGGHNIADLTWEPNKMTNSQDQANAEKIAGFLGMSAAVNYDQQFPKMFRGIDGFTRWLASNDGTVAMIEKLRGDGMNSTYEQWKLLCEIMDVSAGKYAPLNTALQDAILKLLEVK